MSNPPTPIINLSLPAPAVELVLSGLAELPLKVAGNLFAHIQATARAQVAAAAAAPAAEQAQAGDKPADKAGDEPATAEALPQPEQG